jgi:hypothetical protein
MKKFYFIQFDLIFINYFVFRWLESPVPIPEPELVSATEDLELHHPNCDKSASSHNLSNQKDSRVSLPSPYIHRDSRVSLPSPYTHRDSRVSLPSPYTHRDSRVSLPSPYAHIDSRVSLPSPYNHRDSRVSLPDQNLRRDSGENATNPSTPRNSLSNQKPVELTKPNEKTTGLQKKDSIYSRLAKKKPKSLTFSMPSGKLSRYERDRAIIQHSNLTVFPSKPLPLHISNNNNSSSSSYNNNNFKKNGHESNRHRSNSKGELNSSGGNSSNIFQPVGLCTMKEGNYRL